MATAILVENLGKRYLVGHQTNDAYATLRETLAGAVRRFGRRIVPPFMPRGGFQGQGAVEEFWALRGVSFQVWRGERLGIVGRNGAGKSTLLKVISRITTPTTGSVRLKGRVASLLEVGTGFHPELTGRENVYLNGAILGMTRQEINRKFDEIVSFAEIERFLDTPVKRYSSGMYVRLAFGVAAHLDSDILIVDEVLAVGDAQFQRKCLGKMKDVASAGRTVLFVTHNMAAVTQFCERAILLCDGGLAGEGPPAEIVNQYLSDANTQTSAVDLSAPDMRRNSLEHSPVKWVSLTLLDSQDRPCSHLGFLEPFALELMISVTRRVTDLYLAFAIQSALGITLFNSFQFDSRLPTAYDEGSYRFRAAVNQNPFAPGIYEIGLGANGPGAVDWIPLALQFTISSVSVDGQATWGSHKGGMMIHSVVWSVEKEPGA